MADEERTSETREASSTLASSDPSEKKDASPAKEATADQDARAGDQRNDVPVRDQSSTTEPRGEESTSEGARVEGEVLEKDVVQERVEREEENAVQEKQESVTEEVGHRESEVESREAVKVDENQPPVPEQPADSSSEPKESQPAAVNAAEAQSVEQFEPLPEYLPDDTPQGNVEEVNKEAEGPSKIQNSVEASVEVQNSAEAAVEEQVVREPSPGKTEASQTLTSPLLVRKAAQVIDRSPVPFEKSPFRSGSLGRAEREETPSEKRVKLSTGEIRIPNLKAQLNSIIKDIEDNVEPPPPQEEAQEEIGEDGQVYHTWKPKGKYELEQTPVVREEVVPIAVDDVPEPPPVEQALPEEEGAESERQEGDQEGDGSGTVKIQPVMPNGTPASPIEIPEGIPLLARILPKEEDSNREKIPLERLFTPATDSGEITPRKKKAFASSDFYAPDHPTIDDQLQLAQKISGSLVDQTNKTSRGQAMYEKRKQRSEKWIHTAQSSETFSINDSTPKPSKPAMKLVMNPKGVQDHTTVEQHYEQLMQESSTTSSGPLPSHIGPSVHIPASPEIAKDIINDMQSPTGKGAALFAKRKKRMDKFIVDETNVLRSSAYQQQSVVNSSFEQSFTNQVSSFSSSSSSTVQQQQQQQPAPAITAPPGSKKRLQQERDLEQQKIMNEFLNKRESQFQMVKSPWEAALEGNTASAFKQNTSVSKMGSSYSSSTTVGQGAPPAWLEGPKPVPISAPVSKPVGSSLPNPPSPFARPAANGPATLPDISTILTTSNPTKSFKAAGVPITPALNLNSHIASKPVSVRSPRSSSVGHKPSEKRLSTIPKAAQYPFPSYLSLASKQGGCARSSSMSSIPSLSASVSASNSVFDVDFNLKPGSPPIVVQPNYADTQAKTEEKVVDESQNSVQNNIYKDVKLRKVPTKEPTTPGSRPSSGYAASIKHGIESPVNGGKASALFRLSNSSSPYDFSANASAEKEVLKLMSNEENSPNNSRPFISLSSKECNNLRSAISVPSTSASSSLKPTAASLTLRGAGSAKGFNHSAFSSSFESTGSRFENKFGYNAQNSSLNRSKSFSSYDGQSSVISNVASPIKYAQVNKVVTHPPVPNFASTYLVSPKVDKKVHRFDFDAGVKIHLDADDEDSNDEELDAYVAEIQRSITSSPIPLENIRVEDLKPPEFFRSVSRNDEPEESTSDQGLLDLGDGPFEEHGVVVASIFEKKSPVQQCTVSKPKVLNRDSFCPSGLTMKQQAVSNLEMLSTLSALSRVSPDPRSSKSPEPNSLQQGSARSEQQINLRTETTNTVLKSEINYSSMISNSSEPVVNGGVSINAPTGKIHESKKIDIDDPNVAAPIEKDEQVENLRKGEMMDEVSKKIEDSSIKEMISSKPDCGSDSVLAKQTCVEETVLKSNTELTIERNFASEEVSNNADKQEASEKNSKSAEAGQKPTEKPCLDEDQPLPDTESPSTNTTVVNNTQVNVSSSSHALEEQNSHETRSVTVESPSLSLPEEVEAKADVQTSKASNSTNETCPPDTAFNHETIDDVPFSDSKADVTTASKSIISEDDAAANTSSTAVAFETTSASISDPHNVAHLPAALPASPANSSSAVNDSDSAAAATVSASNVDPISPSSKLAKPVESLSPLPTPSSTETKAPASGLVYSAEVKLEQPTKGSRFIQSAAAAPPPAAPAFKAAAPAPTVPAFTPAAATPVFVPGVSSTNQAPSFGNQSVGFGAPSAAPAPAVNPPLGAQFTPRATIGAAASPSLADKRKSANFNLAASGWGTYNEYYRPTSFAS